MRTSARKSKNPPLTARNILVCGVAAVALLGLLPTTGCGGGSKAGNSTGAAQSRGGLTFSVQWPDKRTSRVIPLATESIRITLARTVPGPTVQPVPNNPRLLVAPNIPPDGEATPRTSTATFDGLEIGTYQITVVAYPNADGTGTPLAQATVTQAVSAGANSPLAITLNATVATATVAPKTGPNLRIGRTRQFTVTFRDSAGAIVPVDPAAVSWTSDTPGVVTVNSSGLATMVGLGTGTVRATYKEPYTASGAEGTGATDTGTVNVVEVGIALGQGVKFRNDLQNSGQFTTGTPVAGAEDWRATTNSQIVFSSPVVGPDGTVYIGAYDANLYAFNPDGSLKWKFATGNAIEATPIIGRDGTVYIGSLDGRMYALRQRGNTQEGEQVWSAPFTANGSIYGSATISDGNADTARNGFLFFGTSDTVSGAGAGRTLYKVDALDGTQVGTFNATGTIQTAPAFSADSNTVYFGTTDGKLYAVDANTMTPVWVKDTGAANSFFSSSPAVDRATGNIYIGGLDGNVYGYDSAGNPLANYPVALGVPIYSSPAVATNGALYVGTFDNVSGVENHNLVSIDRAGGTVTWNFPVGGGITSSPSVGADGTIYVGAYDGFLYAVDAAGVEKFRYNLGDNIDSTPGLDNNGRVYIGGFNGVVAAVR